MSRDKSQCNSILITAYDKACIDWDIKYPELARPFITWTFRNEKEQNDLFFVGRDVSGKIINKAVLKTNARWLQSPHNYLPSYAFDIAFISKDGKLDWTHDLFEKFWHIIKVIEPQIAWGYDWNGNDIKDKNDFDAPHYELRIWKTLIKKEH